MEEEQKVKSKSKKKKKLLVFAVVVVIVIVAILVILSTINPPSPYLEVIDVVDNTSKYNETEVEVAGTVGEIIESNVTGSVGIEFELFDREDDTKVILVEYTASPEGMITGKDVVVTGTMYEQNGEYRITAKEVKVGCPSKYE